MGHVHGQNTDALGEYLCGLAPTELGDDEPSSAETLLQVIAYRFARAWRRADFEVRGSRPKTLKQCLMWYFCSFLQKHVNTQDNEQRWFRLGLMFNLSRAFIDYRDAAAGEAALQCCRALHMQPVGICEPEDEVRQRVAALLSHCQNTPLGRSVFTIPRNVVVWSANVSPTLQVPLGFTFPMESTQVVVIFNLTQKLLSQDPQTQLCCALSLLHEFGHLKPDNEGLLPTPPRATASASLSTSAALSAAEDNPLEMGFLEAGFHAVHKLTGFYHPTTAPFNEILAKMVTLLFTEGSWSHAGQKIAAQGLSDEVPPEFHGLRFSGLCGLAPRLPYL